MKHDEQAAEKLLNSGLSALGIARSDLEGMKKSDDRKKAIAWLIRKNTSVKNQWIARALQMGNVATVSRGAGAVGAATSGSLVELKRVISEIND